MAEWIFRVNGTAPTLDPDEEQEVIAEALRLRDLLGKDRDLPLGTRLVRINQNPSGLLGEYVSLLLDARVRDLPDRMVLPDAIRDRYDGRAWFAVSLDALSAFAATLAAVRSED